MMILERNQESSWNQIKNRSIEFVSNLPPSPVVYLIQLLPRTHLEYVGMILLKFQGK